MPVTDQQAGKLHGREMTAAAEFLVTCRAAPSAADAHEMMDWPG